MQNQQWVRRFVWDQSYGKTFDAIPTKNHVRGSGRTVAVEATSIALDLNLTAALAGVTYPLAQPDERHQPSWKSIQTIVYNALGIVRREMSSLYNDHRAYPSPRCLFPTRAYVVAYRQGRVAVAWHDPVRHVLVPAQGDQSAEAVFRSTDAEYAIVVATHYAAILDYYRGLRYTLAMLEAGHALYNLAMIAAAANIRSRVHLSFADRQLLDLIDVQPADGWGVAGVVTLGAAAERRDLPSWLSAAPGPSTPQVDDVREDLETTDITRFDAAAWLESEGDIRGWRDATTRSASPRATTEDVRVATPRNGTHREVTDILFRRNSGRGVQGLSAKLVTVSTDVLARGIYNGLSAMPTDLGGISGWSHVATRCLVVLERVEGLSDGIYEVFPAERALRLRRRGRFLLDVQRASTVGVAMHIHSFNLAWCFVVDYPRIIRERGARGVRLANIELGWMGQGISCAMEAMNLFARPCRSYDEGALDRLLELSASESVGYQLVCGVNRHRDMILDLRT